MRTDCYSGQHTTTSDQAILALEDATASIAEHRLAADALTRALEHDPQLVAATALQGFGTALLAKSENFVKAREFATTANAKLQALKGGTEFEKTLVEALNLAANGSFKAAADRLDQHLDGNPCTFVAAKLSHALRFMSGQPNKMLQTTTRILPHWAQEQPGYGYVLGCHAFGLEESGQYSDAEKTGLRAVELEPGDAWGLHAVSHVMEMSGRTDEGAHWLEQSRPRWRDCNNFSYHLGWHLALFRLEQNDHNAVLKLYDEDIRPTQTDDFRDMANAVSLLWRLDQENVDVGDRWHALHKIASDRRQDTSYVFASLHYLLALVANGDKSGAHDLVEQLRNNAQERHCSKSLSRDQDSVARSVGLQVAELILSLFHGPIATTNLARLSADLTDIGGSYAQRDVFLRTLMLAAADAGDAEQVSAISRIRQAQRTTDRFERLIEKRLQDVGSHAQSYATGQAVRAG